MKYSFIAATSIALLAASATAFAVGPQNSLSKSGPSTSSRISTSLNMSQDDFAKSEIDNNSVVVFSKSYCPFCEKTKALFDDLGVEYAVHELDKMGDDGPDLQMALFKMTGQKSVPNVFVKGQHLGGNDDTQAAAREGKLQEMLGL